MSKYTPRGLPSNVVPDEQIFWVAGKSKSFGSGILEWCYDELDAIDRIQKMCEFPEEFSDLSVECYIND